MFCFSFSDSLLSGRILAGCYWFSILIFVSTYTANLAAFFTVKNAVHPINNLQDIVKSSYQVGVLEAGSTYEVFKTSQYETYKKIWYRIQTGDTAVKSVSDGVQWVRNKQEFVFLDDGPTIRYIANQPPCDLTVGKNDRFAVTFLKTKYFLVLESELGCTWRMRG